METFSGLYPVSFLCFFFPDCFLIQFKSLETTLAGALRREQMAEISIKQLEAEIEQLNRLVILFVSPCLLFSTKEATLLTIQRIILPCCSKSFSFFSFLV